MLNAVIECERIHLVCTDDRLTCDDMQGIRGLKRLRQLTVSFPTVLNIIDANYRPYDTFTHPLESHTFALRAYTRVYY